MLVATIIFWLVVPPIAFLAGVFCRGAWNIGNDDETLVRPSMRQTEPVYAGNVIDFRRGTDFVRV